MLKKIYTLFFFVILLAQSTIAQLLKEKQFNPTIKKVTVYFSAAQVFRNGSINLDKGTNTILVKNVHGSLIKNRINVQANSKVRVLQIDYSTDILQMEKTKDSLKLKSYQDTIVQIDKDLRKIKYQVSVLQTEKKMIESNSTISSSSNNVAFSQSNELQKLSAIYSTRYAEINKLLFNLNEDEINQLSKKDNYQKKINAYKLEEQKNNLPYITITLNAEETMLADLEINYLINDAAWKPKYTLAVDDVSNEMMLNYDALIKNTSGDNWNNVALSLSTSDPITSSSLPTLKPWVINKYTASMNEGYFNNSGAKNFMFNDAPSEAAKLEDKKVNTTEEISVPEMVMDFTITGQSDILSGTKPSLVNISRNKLNATYDYFTIPKIENKAFLVAKVTGWEKLSLIEGSVDVFYQNKFVGESTISPQFANDTLDISLGRSTRILVNRIKINDKNNRSIFSNDIIETVTYRTTIRNTSNTSVKIQVEDQLPISQDPEIEVKSIEISGGKLDGNSGIITWRYDLAALEAKEILVSFSVKYPKNKAGLFNSEIQRKRSRSKF